jgi:CheY-like chemotaxis protein
VTTANPTVNTLLVVEDDALAREGLAALLRNRGYAVRTAKNGRVALDMLAAKPAPDLILLDMLLPELDGWHLLDWLRGTSRGSVPVIITTGSILTREWAETNGCAGFLKKPFDEAELFAEIGRVLRPM